MVQINIKIFPPDDAQTERPRQINFDGANRLQFVQIAGKVWVPGLQPLPDLGPLHDFVGLGAGLEKRKNDSVPTLHLIELIEIGNIKNNTQRPTHFPIEYRISVEVYISQCSVFCFFIRQELQCEKFDSTQASTAGSQQEPNKKRWSILKQFSYI